MQPLRLIPVGAFGTDGLYWGDWEACVCSNWSVKCLLGDTVYCLCIFSPHLDASHGLHTVGAFMEAC